MNNEERKKNCTYKQQFHVMDLLGAEHLKHKMEGISPGKCFKRKMKL